MAIQNLAARGQMSNSAAAVLTAGTSQTFLIQKVTIANASGSDVADIKFFIYASGGSAGNTNQVKYIGSLVDDGEQVVSELNNQILKDGDILAAVAGTNTAVNYFINYAKITT